MNPTQADEESLAAFTATCIIDRCDKGHMPVDRGLEALAKCYRDLRTQLADAQKQLSAIKEGADFTGCFTGLTDQHGNKVYFGDTLDFDPTEWGAPYRFTVDYDPRNVTRAHDIKAWCTKVEATRQPTQDKGDE